MKTKVAVNGYGVIGRRVADAVALQDDMELVGVADLVVRSQVAEHYSAEPAGAGGAADQHAGRIDR